MPVKHCCYGTCNSDNRYSDTPWMQGVFFIPFPKPKSQPEKSHKWARLCGRQGFGTDNVGRHTFICSKHFINGAGPTAEHPDPIPAAATPFELKRSSKKSRPPPKHRSPLKRKKLRMDAETNDDDLIGEHTHSTSPDVPDESLHVVNVLTIDEHGALKVGEVVKITPLQDDNTMVTDKPKPASRMPTAETSVQTDVTIDHLSPYEDENLMSPRSMRIKMVRDDVMKNDDSCRFYTGLPLAMLMLVFGWLSTKAKRMNHWRGEATNDEAGSQKKGPSRALEYFEEFLLCMLRLRRGLDIEHLGNMFGVSPGLVSRIFTTWINLMYLEFKFLVTWPKKEQVCHQRPHCFKKFPRTRSVIDCTEFLAQKPTLPSSQRVTWSQYKHRNTFKALVSVDPKGNFTFVSDLWSGCASDRKIVEESGYLNKIEPGDDVMADRGFLIRDLLALRGATLNIPPFAHGKQMPAIATTKTRRIARARIHVERAIGRLKNFKILQGIIPLNQKPIMDQIVHVCSAFCNLDKQLVR